MTHEIVATSDAARDHDTHPGSSASGVVRRPCARLGWIEIDIGLGITIDVLGCVEEYYCFGERIDDILTGRISGASEGALAEYAEDLAQSQFPFLTLLPGLRTIFESVVLDYAIQTELGARPSDLQLPVFYYCRIGENGNIELDTNPPETGPRFEWATTLGDEYDVPGETRVVIDELTDRIEASIPQPRSIPPLDEGKTYIKFPMWLWLDEPVEAEGIWSESDLATIRIQARATLVGVDWDWGHGSIECDYTAGSMKEWVEGLHPWNDRPDCVFVVDELVDFDLEATSVYKVEHRTLIRPSVHEAWPDLPWIDDGLEVEAVSVPVSVSTRQLLALNVSEAQTD